MSTKFIADLHLYDYYSMDWRGYLERDLDGYASLLIDGWNSTTQDDDVVIIAGDVGHYCEMTVSVLQCLKGHKILIVGNHDLEWGEKLYSSGVFEGIHSSANLNGVYVQHKPDIEQTLRSNSRYFIHGHHHRYDMPNMQRALFAYARDIYRLNCAADLIKHKPRTLQELITQKELLLEKYVKQGLLQEDYLCLN